MYQKPSTKDIEIRLTAERLLDLSRALFALTGHKLMSATQDQITIERCNRELKAPLNFHDLEKRVERIQTMVHEIIDK